VNYFLGLVICKLFAAKKLDAPWTLHLDVWRDVLNPTLLAGRSRPDMVAQSRVSRAWHAFECKGRASTPGLAEKRKAKTQANRLIAVGRTNCTLHVGAITYYRGDVLEFYWRDPEPEERDAIKIPQPAEEWREYYSPFLEAYRFYGTGADQPLTGSSAVSVRELDLTLKMHPGIGELLLASEWERARTLAREIYGELERDGYGPDGLLVKAGESWQERSEDRTRLRE
jgi:hypothetical protein